MSTAASALSTAFAHHQAGRLELAEEFYNQVLAANPKQADALHLLGVVAHQNGRHRRAVECISRAIASNPNNAGFHSNLGEAHRALKEFDRAETAYRRAIELNPGAAQAHHNLGVSLEEQGKLPEASDCYRRAVAARPDYVKALNSLGNTLKGLGRLEEAADSYRRALQFQPDSPQVLFNLANVLQDQEKLAEAVEVYHRAIRLDPEYADAHNNLGSTLRLQGRLDEAAAAYRRAVEIKPDFAEAHQNLAVVLQGRGDHDLAIEHYRKTIALDRGRVRVFADIVNSKRFTEDDRPEIDEIERLLTDESLPRETKSQLNFALGKAFNDCRQWDRAFDHYRRGNELADVTFDQQASLEYVKAMIDTFTAETIAERSRFGRDSWRPIFIVGMPRSGTTLVEQIVASHPKATGGGELDELRVLSFDVRSLSRSSQPYPRCMADIDRQLSVELADRYLERLNKIDPEARRVTDKMPQNFLYLGLIDMLLPGARVIHCRRHPLDVCLSCYFVNFTQRLSFAYSLESLGVYYRHYEMLMDHWRRVRPTAMFEVDYERLVADQEGVSRRLIEFCGLDWHAECLSFHKNRRPVQTASSWQVRRPIYSRSVERWKHYEQHLNPLKDALAWPR